MCEIFLDHLEFFAYHGVSEEERQVGNRYAVDVRIITDFSGAAIEDNIKHTINYETVYHIVKNEMAIPTKLLEHLGYRIVKKIFSEFDEINEVYVSISKFNPPIGGVCRTARIRISEKR